MNTQKKDTFINAINNTKIVKVTINSYEKWIIERHCIPFDFWPSRKYKDWKNRYHFWDLDSPDKKHNLSIVPEKLISIEIIKDSFNPGNYVSWKPRWFVQRDWGQYS